MAAAIVPMIASGVTALLPLVPGIIAQVNQLFGKGNGDKKMAAATSIARAAADHAVQANKIQSMPSDDALQAMIQTVFQLLRDRGKEPGVTPTPSAPVETKPDPLPETAAPVVLPGVPPTPISLPLPPTDTNSIVASGQKITIVGTLYLGDPPKGA